MFEVRNISYVLKDSSVLTQPIKKNYLWIKHF